MQTMNPITCGTTQQKNHIKIYINIVITSLQIHRWISKKATKQLGESKIYFKAGKDQPHYDND
jgi:hypothetical protein